MPIKKIANTVTETPLIDKDQFDRTGVVRDDQFALCDAIDRLKQIQFDTSALPTNSILKMIAGASAGDVNITFPAVSGTLMVPATESPSFGTIQTDTGTSPVADQVNDTLTLTSAGATVLIAGNATTDTVDLSTPDNKSNQKIQVSKAGSLIGTRKNVNLVEGANVTITTADNPGSDRIDVTIAATSEVGLVEGITLYDSNAGIGAQTYTIDLYAMYPFTINQLKIIAGTGSCTAAVKINGTSVTGISAVSVTTAMATGNASAANTVVVGDKVTLVISSNSALGQLQATIKTTRT